MLDIGSIANFSIQTYRNAVRRRSFGGVPAPDAPIEENFLAVSGDLTGTEPDTLSNGQSWGGPLPASMYPAGDARVSLIRNSGQGTTSQLDRFGTNKIDFLTGNIDVTISGALQAGQTGTGHMLMMWVGVDEALENGYSIFLFHSSLRYRRLDAGSSTVVAQQDYSSGFQAGKSHTIRVYRPQSDTDKLIVDLNSGETVFDVSQPLYKGNTVIAAGVRQRGAGTFLTKVECEESS